jgi:outer membrane protein TolC
MNEVRIKILLLSFLTCMIAVPQFSLKADSLEKLNNNHKDVITLAQGLEMVLRDSRLVKIELAEQDMAFEDTLIALSDLLPHLNLNASRAFNQNQSAIKFGSQNLPVADKELFTWGFDIYQTLFDFGKSISTYQASNKSLLAKRARVESIKRIVSFELVTVYLDLLETEKMINVQQKEVESITAYLGDMAHLYKEGVIVKNDLLPAKVKLADAEQKLIASRNKMAVASARLKTILAMPLKRKIIAQEIGEKTFKLEGLDAAWQSAHLQRPEVQFYDNQIKASLLLERASRAENFPNIFLDTGYDHTSDSFQANKDNGYIRLGAKLNLYDGGSSFAKVLKERDLRRKLTEQRNKLIEDIDYEIQDSFLGLKNAYKKLSVARGILKQATENVRVNRVKYNNGAATSTDVLEAITYETTSQTNYCKATYELERYYAKFMYSTGVDLVLSYKQMEADRNAGTKR